MTIDNDIQCTPEETSGRLEFCKSCPKLAFNDAGYTMCGATGCLINLMTTFKFKGCPEGNWE